jgi:hypothetical protein
MQGLNKIQMEKQLQSDCLQKEVTTTQVPLVLILVLYHNAKIQRLSKRIKGIAPLIPLAKAIPCF